MKLVKAKDYKLVYLQWVDPYVEHKETVLGADTMSDHPGVNHLVGFVIAENKMACCVVQTLLFKQGSDVIEQHAAITIVKRTILEKRVLNYHYHHEGFKK